MADAVVAVTKGAVAGFAVATILAIGIIYLDRLPRLADRATPAQAANAQDPKVIAKQWCEDNIRGNGKLDSGVWWLVAVDISHGNNSYTKIQCKPQRSHPLSGDIAYGVDGTCSCEVRHQETKTVETRYP